jgi:hypothetical protein
MKHRERPLRTLRAYRETEIEIVMELRSRAASICFPPSVRDSPRDEYRRDSPRDEYRRDSPRDEYRRDSPFDFDDFYTLHVSGNGAGVEDFNVEMRPRFATMADSAFQTSA